MFATERLKRSEASSTLRSKSVMVIPAETDSGHARDPCSETFAGAFIIVGAGRRVNAGESVEARDWRSESGRSRYNLGMNLRIMRLRVERGAAFGRVGWMLVLTAGL